MGSAAPEHYGVAFASAFLRHAVAAAHRRLGRSPCAAGSPVMHRHSIARLADRQSPFVCVGSAHAGVEGNLPALVVTSPHSTAWRVLGYGAAPQYRGDHAGGSPGGDFCIRAGATNY